MSTIAPIRHPKSTRKSKPALGLNHLDSVNGAESFIAAAIAPPSKRANAFAQTEQPLTAIKQERSKSVPLTLYQSKYNASAKKIRHLLDRKGLSYQAINVAKWSQQSKEIKQRMGEFCLPVLQHGDLWMGYDRITSYLNEQFPDKKEQASSLLSEVLGLVFSAKEVFRGR